MDDENEFLATATVEFSIAKFPLYHFSQIGGAIASIELGKETPFLTLWLRGSIPEPSFSRNRALCHRATEPHLSPSTSVT